MRIGHLVKTNPNEPNSCPPKADYPPRRLAGKANLSRRSLGEGGFIAQVTELRQFQSGKLHLAHQPAYLLTGKNREIVLFYFLKNHLIKTRIKNSLTGQA